MVLADPTKAQIIHVLKDGTVLDSIEGHIVRIEDAEPMYRMFLDMGTTITPSARRNHRNVRRNQNCVENAGIPPVIPDVQMRQSL